LKRHLERHHKNLHDEVQEHDKALVKKSKITTRTKPAKRLAAASNLNQSSIKQWVSPSPVFGGCLELVVMKQIPFTVFDSDPLRKLTNWAKVGAKDNSKKVVNAINLRAGVIEQAKQMRDQIQKLLQHKIVGVTADFASVENRSFLGKFS
jgi:hypothetical protein